MDKDKQGSSTAVPEVNKVLIVGRLVSAPTTKLVNDQHKMARFMLAVTRTYRNGAGEPARSTAYVPVAAWRALAQQAETFGKGDAVRVEGRLRTWQSPEGQKYRWELEADYLDVLQKQPQAPAAPTQPELAGV